MDLPEKGAHCSLDSCKIFDLLPITCPACEQQFCKTHASRDAHVCTAQVAAPSTTSSSKRAECQVEQCDRPGLVSFKQNEDNNCKEWSCDTCRGVYCVEHRHTDAHKCVPIPTGEPTTDKKSEAQALLNKLFPNVKSQAGTSRSAVKKTTDPAKVAKLRAIELMRMKHKAVAGDPRSSAQPKDKVHLKVVWGTSEKVVWFVKTAVTGHAVDLAARICSVSREDGRGMVFVLGDETDGPLKNEVELGAQVEDGDTVWLAKM
ncbi:AN1-like Zinc finger [Rhizoctonia solani]|uniref:AN1-like Zinc finger n=1 Tax=Rhizoctonia solani TaxID=456999 RepID=A0A8H7IGI0_9AGAM|nr:AN1-like Zinc finger [Rhizoctonia solani]